jgi:hypothetical protein
MTQDEMIELAKQAGWQYAHGESGFEPLWAFAKLVAEKERERLTDAAMKAAEKAVDVAVALEREACAKLFELTDLSGLKSDVWLQNYTATILDGYAKAIRARGQAC